MRKKLIFAVSAITLLILGLSVGNKFVTTEAARPENKLRTLSRMAPQASTTIVISQVYGGGGGSSGTYLRDYVELKNISSTAQSLNGLSLMYGSSGGQFGSSTANVFALPNVTLQPGQFFLLEAGASGTAGTALPVTPDAQTATTGFSMSGTAGKVALTNGLAANSCGATATPCSLPNSQIIDLVAYGTANNAEGTAITGPSTTQGAVRKGSGCTDTDNNLSDFELVSPPVPRNTSSSYTACSSGGTTQKPVADFNGDGKTDFAVTRDNGGNKIWYTALNGSSTVSGAMWGVSATDAEVPADFDGDGKADIAVWRESPTGQATFYILRSSDSTVQTEPFGQGGDDPSVTADYDGDGKADPAVFRCPINTAGQCYFYYRGSLNNPSRNITFIPWGSGISQTTIVPLGGDFDGDGKFDFCVGVDGGGGNGMFILLKSSNFGVEYVPWGLASDQAIPRMDYDGDGKTDFAVARLVGSAYTIHVLTRTGGGTGASPIYWGTEGDNAAFGDYDGDGKTDIGVWRAGNGTFFIRKSSDGSLLTYSWGMSGDRSVTEWVFPRLN